MNHGVYHALPYRHSELMQIVLMEANLPRGPKNRRLRHLYTVQSRIEQQFAFCHSSSAEAVVLRKAAAKMNVYSKILNALMSRSGFKLTL